MVSKEQAEKQLAFLRWCKKNFNKLGGQTQTIRTEFQSVLTNFIQEIESIVAGMATKAQTSKIERAIESGVLELHKFQSEGNDAQLLEFMTDCIAGATRSPLLESRKPAMSQRNSEIVREFAEGVFSTVTDGSTYPLFDGQTNEFVKAAIRDGWIKVSDSAVGRGKHGGLAGHLLKRLPSFDQASVDEILDIRKELDRPLIRFRSAVIQFSEEIRSASWDKDFPSDAGQVFYKNVAPAVLDMEEAIKSNTALMAFLRTLARDPASFLSEGTIAVVLGTSSSLPGEIALGLGTAAAIAGIALVVYRAYDDWAEKERAIEQNQLYFYYQAGKQLEQR
jgi:hypothetical protein